MKLVVVHTINDAEGGCEFEHFFSTAPPDLVQAARRARPRLRVTFFLPPSLPPSLPTYLPTYLPTHHWLATRPRGRRASSRPSPARSSSTPPTSARSGLGLGFLALGFGSVGFGFLGSGVFGFGSRAPHPGAQVSISLILESFARKSSGINRGPRRMSHSHTDTMLKGLVGGPLGNN